MSSHFPLTGLWLSFASLVSDLYDPPPVIRLRLMLERGRAHPLLGPILLVVLALLLAIVFLHMALGGNATEIGAMCLALATVVGLPLLERLNTRLSEPSVAARGDRGPPWLSLLHAPRPGAVASSSQSLPLRR